MIKKLQCKDCGQAEYSEDLYNYNGETLCRYCIVSKLCETSSNCEYIGTCNDKKYSNKINNLQHQLYQQKEMWSKLKEWLGRVLQLYLNDFDKKTTNLISSVIDKMQELEKGEKDDKS